jgi:hypothetical protein
MRKSEVGKSGEVDHQFPVQIDDIIKDYYRRR